MSIKQISVFLENKPGALYAMTGVLAQNIPKGKAFAYSLSISSCSTIWIPRLARAAAAAALSSTRKIM